MTVNQLTYFVVSGHWHDVEAPDPSDNTNNLQFQVITAFVTFTPRLKPGTVEYITNLDLGGGNSANTALAIAPVTARILQGELQTINREDTPDLHLLANSAVLGLTAPLIYDVAFTNVVYASTAQTIKNFAFTAPIDTTPIDLTDPALTRLEYNPTNYPA